MLAPKAIRLEISPVLALPKDSSCSALCRFSSVNKLSSILCVRGLESVVFMNKPVIGVTGNETPHPDDKLIVAKVLLKVLRKLKEFIIPGGTMRKLLIM